jgi:hypothetical protein
MLATLSVRATISRSDYTHIQKGRGPGSWQLFTPPGSPGPSHAPGKEANNVNDNLNDKAGPRAAVPFANAWGLSLEEWLASERDMDNQDDYDRWVAEMGGEVSDAGKQTAGLNTGNAPF